MSDRRSNFSKNLNFLKENKGFSVPFLASEIDAEKRTVEKWFYENRIPDVQLMTKLMKFVTSEYGVTEDQLFGPPNREIGKVPPVSRTPPPSASAQTENDL